MTDLQHPQLPLRLTCKPYTDFANFIEQGNEQVMHRLSQSVSGLNSGWIYLWGNQQCGKSHLLQAACQLAEDRGQQAFYLASNEIIALSERMLEDLDAFDVVAIDDLQMIVGDRGLEESLFHFYNRMRDQGKLLLVAADSAPRYLQTQLPDLGSRLAAMEIYQVSGLSDSGRAQVLQLWAQQRGFELSNEVVAFILRRAERNLTTLFEIVEQLDHRSLQEKRLITVPFVKKVMGC